MQDVPVLRYRLFYALVPGADVRAAMAERAGQWRHAPNGPRARWVDPLRYHATLLFLGDFAGLEQPWCSVLVRALNGVPAHPVTWTLDRIASFPGRRPPCILLGKTYPEALHTWWEALRRSVCHVPGVQLDHRFVPHVTLAYLHDTRMAPVPVEPLAWKIDQLALLRSRPGQAHYDIIASRDLAD